ncbi:MAG: sulfatase [Planctomycetes bacterium]|nr:sulfatase [Planctomycetota bacterium]
MHRPNIVLITWHDLGDWLGCYGREDVSSPCLDGLARQGVVFDNYFCTAPQCSPSRASMVTGLMPHSTGVLGLTHRGFDMDRDAITLPQLLKQGGYTTHLFGLQHECNDSAREGYDDIRSKSRHAKYVAEEAESFFANASANDPPFFLAIGTSDVHRPYGETYDPEVMKRIQMPPYLPDCEAARRDLAVFYNNIKEADRQMGRIFDALDKSGLADDTLVIFTTDHGAALPRAKTTLYDSGIKIAMMMRWPRVLRGGVRTDALLSNVDLFPTILDIAEVKKPIRLHGRSFANLLFDKPHEPRREIFAEMTWHTQYRPMRAIRTKDHKYIINYCGPIPMIVEGGAISRYGAGLTEEYYSSPLPREELYDLQADPDEMNNLADDPCKAQLKAQLRNHLLHWMTSTNDPILKGTVPNPHPDRAEPEVWVRDSSGRFKLRMDVKWPWEMCKP